MNLLISLYKLLMPFIYIAAGIYLLAAYGTFSGEIQTTMGVVILLYGVYRIVRQLKFTGMNEERDTK